MSLPALGAAFFLLLLCQFLVWKATRMRLDWLGLLFFLPWTLWFAEAFLCALEARSPQSADEAPTWAVRSLPAVAGHPVPADLGAAPSEQTTVVVMGDSFAAGQGVREQESFARVVGAGLTSGGLDARVLLQAIPGWNAPEEVIAYGALAAPLAPDVVVWTFVLNDLGLPGDVGLDDLITSRDPQPGPWRLADHVRRARHARQLDLRTTQAYLGAFDPERPAVQAFRAQLPALAGEVTGRGGRFVLLIFPLLHRLDAYPFAEVHHQLRAMGEAAGAEVLDLLDVFQGRDASALWASRADHHPNARAHALVAEALRDHLLRGELPRAGPTRCEVLPAPEGLEAALRAACTTPDAHGALDLAETLLALDEAGRASAYDARGMAAHLAVVALHRAEGLAEAARRTVHQRAVAVVHAWRRGR